MARTNSGRATSGAGAKGTSYSGGSGGGGIATWNQTQSGNAASANGGAGGDGKQYREGNLGYYIARRRLRKSRWSRSCFRYNCYQLEWWNRDWRIAGYLFKHTQ